MKAYLTLAIALLTISMLQAQDIVITGTKKITKKATPQQVVDSLNKRFPNAKSVQYFEASPTVVANGWTVAEDDNLGSGDVDYYTISFKQDSLQYYGLYASDGTLVESKIAQKLNQLPPPVRDALNNLHQTHPGYTIVSQNYYKELNHKKSKEFYEVTAKKDNVTKKVYFAPDGSVIKVK